MMESDRTVQKSQQCIVDESIFPMVKGSKDLRFKKNDVGEFRVDEEDGFI